MTRLNLTLLTLALLVPSLAEARSNRADTAFVVLQNAAHSSGAATASPLVIARERASRSLLPRGHVTSDAKLLFYGKRARIQLTVETQLGSAAPRRETHLLRVPLGRLFGWYGRALVRGQFPDLTPAQVSRALGSSATGR